LQRHARQLAHVPGADQDAPRIRIVADQLQRLADLVHLTAVRGAPGAPLPTIHGPELAVGISPFIPDGHAVFAQVAHVGVATQEPQQLVHHGPDVHLLRGQQREAVGQREAHLAAEQR
jgi:hypothetical protein